MIMLLIKKLNIWIKEMLSVLLFPDEVKDVSNVNIVNFVVLFGTI